jgi:hypothetical protein
MSKGVLQILQDVSDEARKNSDSTRNASQTMWRLTKLVEQLRSSVGAFKLRDEQASPVRDGGPTSLSGILPPTPRPAHSRQLHPPTR